LDREFPTRLFNGIARDYDIFERVFTLGQAERWKARVVEKLDVARDSWVMDLGTGTADIAIRIAEELGCQVLAVDQSDEMIKVAKIKINAISMSNRIWILKGRAEDLPLRDASLDAVTFSYVLRYVEDVEATMREIIRVIKMGGQIIYLDFGIPSNPTMKTIHTLYTHYVLPLGGWLGGQAWRTTTEFLPSNIAKFHDENPIPRLVKMWEDLGLGEVEVTTMSLGTAVIISARRKAMR
jgi:demethylmenaquinone methyltransferase/2-methoxy-6-polyprenyl-1,4-benzoquinol methylase